jgi:hypothetical protein
MYCLVYSSAVGHRLSTWRLDFFWSGYGNQRYGRLHEPAVLLLAVWQAIHNALGAPSFRDTRKDNNITKVIVDRVRAVRRIPITNGLTGQLRAAHVTSPGSRQCNCQLLIRRNIGGAKVNFGGNASFPRRWLVLVSPNQRKKGYHPENETGISADSVMPVQ